MIHPEEINGGLIHHFLFSPSAPEEFCHVFFTACGFLAIRAAPESSRLLEQTGAVKAAASVSASGSQNSRILYKLGSPVSTGSYLWLSLGREVC